MELKITFEGLVDAYKRRIELIDEEVVSEDGSLTILALLKDNREWTDRCSELILPMADEVAEYAVHTRRQVENITRGRVDEVEKLSKMQSAGTPIPPLLLELAKMGNRNAEIQTKMLFDQDLLVKMCMNYLMLCLAALYTEEDDAPRKAFFQSLKNGVVDSLLGAFPGGGIVMVLTRSIEEYLAARIQRRQDANHYLRSLETYNEACIFWCDGVVTWIKSLQAIRSEKSAGSLSGLES